MSATHPTPVSWQVVYGCGLNVRSAPELPGAGGGRSNVVGTGLPHGATIIELERADGPDGPGQWVRHAAGWTMAWKSSAFGPRGKVIRYLDDPDAVAARKKAEAAARATEARAREARAAAARAAARAACALKAEKQAHPDRFKHPGVLQTRSHDRRDYDSKDLRHMDDAMFERTWVAWSCCGAVGRAAAGCERRAPARKPPKSATKTGVRGGR